MFASNFLPSPGPKPKCFFTECSLSDVPSFNNADSSSQQYKQTILSKRKPFSTIKEHEFVCNVELLIPSHLYSNDGLSSRTAQSANGTQGYSTNSNQANLFVPPSPLQTYSTITLLPSQLLSSQFNTNPSLILTSLSPSPSTATTILAGTTTPALIIHSSNLTLTVPHSIYERLGLQGRPASKPAPSSCSDGQALGGGKKSGKGAKAGGGRANGVRKHGEGRKIHYGKGKDEAFVMDVDLREYQSQDLLTGEGKAGENAAERKEGGEKAEEKGKSGRRKTAERVKRAFSVLDQEVGRMKVVWREKTPSSGDDNAQDNANLQPDPETSTTTSHRTATEPQPTPTLKTTTQETSTLPGILIPPFPKEINITDTEDDIHSLFEWLSLCFLGSPRVTKDDKIDSLFSRYQVPSQSDGEEERVQDLTEVEWKGFISPEFVMGVFLEAVRATQGRVGRGSGEWFAVSVMTLHGEAYTMLGTGDGRVLLWEYEE